MALIFSQRLPGKTPYNIPDRRRIRHFFGVVAWDLLADGHLEIIRAALIAGACSLAWIGLRCWKNKTRSKHPMR
ncbi:hypothetical protein [Propionivibrio sp.]|uniref:hypothetical protein n=1 Tax=Propionivibrio sp. TaxID=2212460 RepID=UPI003BF25369